MGYDEAVARFGVDRPDTRFGLEIRDVGELLRGSDFKVFESVLGGGGVVRAINAGARELSRSELEGLNDVVRVHGAKAVAPIYVRRSRRPWAGNLAKFFTRRADRRGQRRARGVRRRPAAVRRRHARRSPPRRSAGCGCTWPSASG